MNSWTGVLAIVAAVSTTTAAWFAVRVRRLSQGVATSAKDANAPVKTPTGDVTINTYDDAVLDPTRSAPTLVAALDALSLAVVVADADEVLTFQNRSADEILNAHDGRALITKAVRALLVEAVRGEANERELELFGPPSSSYLIRAVPLVEAAASSEDRRLVGGVAVIEDITERRRVDQVRRDFVSNIGHELKTPVGAVGLLAETLRDETDLETIGRFSGRIADEVGRLTRTIDDLLALSRIEFADDLFKDRFVIGTVLDDVVGLYRNAAQARDIQLVVTGERDLVVRADRRQISSAVSNLVDNAVKYSPAGAEVRIDLARADGESSNLVISVIDVGIGIPSSDLDRVFERFYRVDQARSRATGGTGLGLAIVRHVAHNHGGNVAVQSREGRGSVFSLTIPIGQSDDDEEEIV